MKSKEEDYSDFCLDFVQESGHWKLYLAVLAGEGVEGQQTRVERVDRVKGGGQGMGPNLRKLFSGPKIPS